MVDKTLSDSENMARAIGLNSRRNERLIQQQVDFLERQGGLQRAQLESLELEHQGHRIHNVHARLRLVFELTLALLAIMVIGFLLQLVVSAWNARNVVISAFDVPPAMQAQGHSGKVLAAALLDQLQNFQAETRASVTKRGVTDAWSGDIKLEIPEAHISVGELQRYLHEWLGHETHIGGSVVQASDGGLALTVRGNGFPAKTFTGKPDTLPALITQAAEYIYGQSETYLFGAYLSNHARDEEAIALIQGAYASAMSSDQPLLLNVWGNALSDLGRNREALDKYREAIRLKPDYWVGWANVSNVQVTLQQEQAAVESGLAMERLARRGHWFDRRVREALFLTLDRLRWDLPVQHKGLAEDLALHGGHGTQSVEGAPIDAQVLAQMHDPRAAELQLQTSPAAGSDAFVIAQSSFVRGLIALDRGEYAKALPLLRSTDETVAASTWVQSNFPSYPSCWLALAEEWTGESAKADADLARGGSLVDCYRFKADISDHRGNWALAQKQYADAVALAPSVPSGYFSWGEALLRHGQFDPAITKFEQANARGPHWADPLKSWGDALAAKGDFANAVKRYERAEEFAPNWAQLHLRWGQALDKLGTHARAVEEYRKALDLDLTDGQRKALEGCCG